MTSSNSDRLYLPDRHLDTATRLKHAHEKVGINFRGESGGEVERLTGETRIKIAIPGISDEAARYFTVRRLSNNGNPTLDETSYVQAKALASRILFEAKKSGGTGISVSTLLERFTQNDVVKGAGESVQLFISADIKSLLEAELQKLLQS